MRAPRDRISAVKPSLSPLPRVEDPYKKDCDGPRRESSVAEGGGTSWLNMLVFCGLERNILRCVEIIGRVVIRLVVRA